ncbi:CBS domain-containing protein [Paracandidimonas soli]|uniref:CBS domain protein n=1 Tax=Paracandidimonas soli TaxID=1917182 RepID=A0A4R3VFB5_9BURK|nr:CBS domain-containing protein [Paracandidimonas soli]TCV01495.1 CBS domain protein [Paracandidimonas soli]
MPLVQAILPAASKRLITIQTTAPLVDAAKLLSTMNISLIVVCNLEGFMSGVVTKSDVVRQISVCEGCSCKTMVSEVMSGNVVTCHPDQDLYDIWLLMKNRKLKQIPVSSQDARPLGLLYANEALEVLLKEEEYEKLLLRDYVMGVGYR